MSDERKTWLEYGRERVHPIMGIIWALIYVVVQDPGPVSLAELACLMSILGHWMLWERQEQR